MLTILTYLLTSMDIFIYHRNYIYKDNMFPFSKDNPDTINQQYQETENDVAMEEAQTEQDTLTRQQIYMEEQSRWLLDPESIIEELEHHLRGEYKKKIDQNTIAWIKTPDTVPILNERGIQAIIKSLQIRINRVTFMSNLEEKHIYDICLTLANDLTELLFNNSEEFGLNWQSAHQRVIIDEIMDFVFIALRKAYSEGERRHWRTIEKIFRRTNDVSDSMNLERKKKLGIF